MADTPEILVVGLGNEFRSDDGVGPVLVRRLMSQRQGPWETCILAGDPSDLLEKWKDRDVIVLDALSAPEGQGGRIHVLRPLLDRSILREKSFSSHALGLMETIEMSSALHRLPRSLTVLAIEGESFAPGRELSSSVEKALEKAWSLLINQLQTYEDRYA